MALVTGFLRQTCSWTPRSEGYDAFGKPISEATVSIPCRWEIKSGWVRGSMGDGTGRVAVQHKVMMDSAVSAGDTLAYVDPKTGKTLGGIVQAIENIVDAAGVEQGRFCYV